MKKIVLLVSGASRTGKDSLIARIGDALDRQVGVPECDFAHISSIDPIKRFYRRLKDELGLDPSLPMTQEDRQFLAEVKGAADKMCGFTVRDCLKHLKTLGEGGVLAYQVRELGNIRDIRLACQPPSDMDRSQAQSLSAANIIPSVQETHWYGIERVLAVPIWIHVQRKGQDGLRAANTDRYKLEDVASADFLVQNTSLEDLNDWAELIARRVNKLRS